MATNELKIRGYIGEVKIIHEGKENQFVSLSICVKEYAGKDKQTGEAKYIETWFESTAFDNVGRSVIASGMKKGDYVELVGPQRSRRPKEDGPLYWNQILNEFDILRRKAVEAVEEKPKRGRPSKAA